jgi:hypothetical protein
VGSLTSHNPIGLQGLLRDSFTLLIGSANVTCHAEASRAHAGLSDPSGDPATRVASHLH